MAEKTGLTTLAKARGVRCKRGPPGGLTVVEIMIAIALFVILAAVAMLSSTAASRANRMAQHKTIALSAAQNEMENILADDPTNVTAHNGRTFPVFGIPTTADGDPGAIVVAAGDPHRITITVTWVDGSVALVALRSETAR